MTSSNLVPPLAAVALVAAFLSLGFWQLDRADQKRAVEAAFAGRGEPLAITGEASYPLYQPLTAAGRYLEERQFLIDNMILDGRLGYFVVTPFEYAPDQPLLLVNRGWVARDAADGLRAALQSTGDPAGTDPAGTITIRGKAGQLPRVGIRAGEVFEEASGWPRTANWPAIADLEAALQRRVLPFVLLAEPEPGSGLLRQWEPRQAGPMRHLGYAFQWFALAAAVVVTAIVLYRRRRAAR